MEPNPYSSLNIESAPVLRVSQAIALCNSLLGQLAFRIEGEVANFSLSRGKFVFFDLKDEQEDSRIGCFMMAFNLSTPIEDGMRVVIEGKAGIHQKSGQFRLTVSRIEPKGQGSVKRSYDLLLGKLKAEGLFDSARKRPLPSLPQRVGLISSAGAAGFGDFMRIAQQRLPGINFFFANVAVQGTDAEKEICHAFDYLNGHYDLDAIVLVRGGGSMEDLHAFNSEQVARAICRSKAPVLVGVGHERDLTIADYCADLRAATPSNAAQLLIPTIEEIKGRVLQHTQEGRRKVGLAIESYRQHTIASIHRSRQQTLFAVRQQRLAIETLLKSIHALSPYETLKRGYAIVQDGKGARINQLSQLTVGDEVITCLAEGRFTSSITSLS